MVRGLRDRHVCSCHEIAIVYDTVLNHHSLSNLLGTSRCLLNKDEAIEAGSVLVRDTCIMGPITQFAPFTNPLYGHLS